MKIQDYIDLGPVPERCNNPIPGINVPGIRYIYPWNRVITPFRNPALECPSSNTGKCMVQFVVPLPCCNVETKSNG